MSEKTKEQLAEEWIDYVLESKCDVNYKISFLAGYQAAMHEVVTKANERLGMMSCPCLRVIQNICNCDPMPVDGVIPEEKL